MAEKLTAEKLPDLEGMDDDKPSVETTTAEKGGGGVEKEGQEQKALQDVKKASKGKESGAEAGAPEPAQDPEPINAPNTWRGETKAKWSELPRWAQEEVSRRERESMDGINTYKSKADIGHAFEQAVTPYIPVLRAMGQEPIQAVQNLLQYQYLLRTDPYNTLARIAQEYGVNLGQLAQMSGAAPQGQSQDPALQGVMQQIGSISARLNQQQLQQQTAQQQEADYEIARFGANPKNEFFGDPAVRQAMGEILKLGFANDMQSAYDKAILNVPHIAAEIQKRTTTRVESERDQQLRQKAANAKRASVDVVEEGASPFGDEGDDLGTMLRKRYRQAST